MAGNKSSKTVTFKVAKKISQVAGDTVGKAGQAVGEAVGEAGHAVGDAVSRVLSAVHIGGEETHDEEAQDAQAETGKVDAEAAAGAEGTTKVTKATHETSATKAADATSATKAAGGEKPTEADKPAESITRMGSANIPALITEFAIPSVVGMLVNGAYNLIDSIFLGHAVGEIGLSTVTVANPTMIVFMSLAMLVGNGGNALAALRLGQGRQADAERTLSNVVSLSIIISLLVVFLSFNPVIIDWLLTASSATDEVREPARQFIMVLCAGFVLQMIGMGVNNFIRTCGAPNRALGTIVIGLVISVALNYLFVMVFGWGVIGSAAATVSGWAASTITVLWYFLFAKGVPMRIRGKYLLPSRHITWRIIVYGFPSFAVEIGMSVVNFVLNAQLLIYGAQTAIGSVNALASIGLVNRVGGFAVMPIIGIAVAIQPLLGYNYGAKLFSRVKETVWVGIAAASSLSTLEWAIMQLFPGPIINLFGINNAELVEFTIFALRVQNTFMLLVGFQIIASNYFQATGQPVKSIFLTLTRQILYLIPLYYLLPLVLTSIVPSLNGLDALYFAVPCADILSVITTVAFFAWEMRRLTKAMVDSGEKRYDAKGFARLWS